MKRVLIPVFLILLIISPGFSEINGFTGLSVRAAVTDEYGALLFSPVFSLQAGVSGFFPIRRNHSLFFDASLQGAHASAETDWSMNGLFYGGYSFSRGMFYLGVTPRFYTESRTNPAGTEVQTHTEVKAAVHFDRFSLFLSPAFVWNWQDGPVLGMDGEAGGTVSLFKSIVLTASFQGGYLYSFTGGTREYFFGPEISSSWYPLFPLVLSETLRLRITDNTDITSAVTVTGAADTWMRDITLAHLLEAGMSILDWMDLGLEVPLNFVWRQYRYRDSTGTPVAGGEFIFYYEPSLPITFALTPVLKCIVTPGINGVWSDNPGRVLHEPYVSIELLASW